MQKPDSIRKFDYLYLGSIVVGLIGLALSWDSVSAQMNVEMAAAGTALSDGAQTGVIIAGFLLGAGISLALWFLISVLRIEFVKWLLILLVLWTLVTLPAGMAATGGFGLIHLLGIISTLMTIVAIWMLFRPDAKEWFAAKRGD